MIKKIILTLILCNLLIACGKKGNPEYKVNNKNTVSKNLSTNNI
jgi:hypothetical protein